MINTNKNFPQQAILISDKCFGDQTYPNVTIGKEYEIYLDFECPNTLFFKNDVGEDYKVIPTNFNTVM
jgi:hypothetical protein